VKLKAFIPAKGTTGSIIQKVFLAVNQSVQDFFRRVFNQIKHAAPKLVIKLLGRFPQWRTGRNDD
jgi:hypothetical protein